MPDPIPAWVAWPMLYRLFTSTWFAVALFWLVAVGGPLAGAIVAEVAYQRMRRRLTS